MKALMRKIDRFCYRRPRFGIPGLIRFIVFGTAIVYVLGLMDTTNTLYQLLLFSPTQILRGQVWRLFTFVFVPIHGQPIFLMILLYLSFMLGTTFVRVWGTAKFTIYYLLSIFVLVTVGMLLHLLPGPVFSSVAMGFLVNGYYIHIFLLLAFATFYPDSPFRFMFIIPMRAKWIGVLSIVGLLYEMWVFRLFFPANLIPLALFLVYFLFTWDAWQQYLGLRSKQGHGTVTNFHRAKRKIEKEQRTKTYTRKCEICGKTDTDDPDMEFRYCSRCNGYHCFCIDHINDHVHFQ